MDVGIGGFLVSNRFLVIQINSTTNLNQIDPIIACAYNSLMQMTATCIILLKFTCRVYKYIDIAEMKL